MRKSDLCLALVGALLVAAAVAAQDVPGDPAEVAAELAAAAAWQAAPVFAPAVPASPLRTPEATVFFSDFNTDNGGLIGTLDWEWGATFAWTGTGCGGGTPPTAPYSGAGMWGTVLNTCYNNLGNNTGYSGCANSNPGDDSILTLSVDLTNYTAATLSWYEWYDLFSAWDWGELRINGAQAFVDCRSSYVAPTAWVLRTVDLAPYVGGVATIEWHMMASTVVNYSGWYIDDVLVDGTPVPVELQAFSVE
jgi:hypothetical protein